MTSELGMVNFSPIEGSSRLDIGDLELSIRLGNFIVWNRRSTLRAACEGGFGLGRNFLFKFLRRSNIWSRTGKLGDRTLSHPPEKSDSQNQDREKKKEATPKKRAINQEELLLASLDLKPRVASGRCVVGTVREVKGCRQCAQCVWP